MILECLLVLVLVNGEAASCAMGMNATSSQQPVAALISPPVSPRHSMIRANHSLVVAIVVLMVLAVVALLCCCYLWERQLRRRIEAARTAPHNLVGEDIHSSRPQMGSSPSVIVLLGDDVTRSTVAWSVPQRLPASPVSEAATPQPTQTDAHQSFKKLAPG